MFIHKAKEGAPRTLAGTPLVAPPESPGTFVMTGERTTVADTLYVEVWPTDAPSHKEWLVGEDLVICALQLDVVLMDDETAEEAARTIAGPIAEDLEWTIVDPGPAGGWPQVTFTGPQKQLIYASRRYAALGKGIGINKGRPPVGKGERR